jgi:hypothetical protein
VLNLCMDCHEILTTGKVSHQGSRLYKKYKFFMKREPSQQIVREWKTLLKC